MIDVESLASTLFGGAVCLALARAYVTKLIKSVEDLETSLDRISTHVSVIEVHVAEFAYVKKTLSDHDRKIAALMEANRFQSACKIKEGA